MIGTWWRGRLGWQLRHRNPQGLSRSEYAAAVRHRDELLVAEGERESRPVAMPHVQLRAHGEAVRRAMTPLVLSRDEQAALAHRQAMAEGGW